MRFDLEREDLFLLNMKDGTGEYNMFKKSDKFEVRHNSIATKADFKLSGVQQSRMVLSASFAKNESQHVFYSIEVYSNESDKKDIEKNYGEIL